MITIDGSKLEGGGQILRMASSLSCITGKSVQVSNIRASRSKPGLKAQHLTGLKLLQKMTNAKVDGLLLDSLKIQFEPAKLSGSSHRADISTAGSTSLLIQSCLPVALFGKFPTMDFIFTGGTNVEMAPQIDYTKEVLTKICRKFGVIFSCDAKVRGFFPRGGGTVCLRVEALNNYILPVQMLDRGEVKTISGIAFAAGGVEKNVAVRIHDSATSLLRKRYNDRNIKMSIKVIKFQNDCAVGSGSGIVLWAETSTGCVFGSSSVGKRTIRPEETGQMAASEMIDILSSKSCVNPYAQDQMIIFMALANGKSRIRTSKLTLHTKTAIWVAETMTEAKFKVTEDSTTGTWIIECDGIGISNSSTDSTTN